MRFLTKPLELNLILDKVASRAKSETIRREILALEPSIDKALIERQLLETSDMLSVILRQSTLPIIEDYDIHELIQYAHLDRVYSITELLYIRLFLVMERDIINYRKEIERNRIVLGSIHEYMYRLHQHGDLLDYIQSKIDPDGQIRDDASPELLRIRKGLIKIEKGIQEKLQKLLIDYQTYINETVIVMRNDRFCIPIKDTFKHKIKGIIHDVSSSKQTVYIEPEATRQLTAELESLKVLEIKEIEKIMALLSEAVSSAKDSLKDNLDLFLTLDFIQSKALYAKEINAHRPTVNDDGMIRLMKAKHPLLDPKTAIPISVELNDDIRTLLITGPNTGGKTVALKTVGLLTLMTQCGLMIPASESSHMSIFHQVFADIGDEQSILQSLSTFSSHLTKIIDMIEHVGDRSLILLDELGSGTDPNEGVSLAMAILDYMMRYNVRMMVTTHYSELKTYAYEKPHMITASVAFDKESLKPLYYLQMGTTGSSHAFLIARRLGLQEKVVSHAETIYQGRQTDLAKIMEKLNDEMIYLEKEKSRLSQEIEQAQKEKNELKEAKEKLLKESDKTIEAIRIKEEAKWMNLKDEVVKILEDLKQKKTLTNPKIADIKYQLKQTINRDDLDFMEDELKIGDDVFITSYQQYGKVKAIKDDDVRVVFGAFDLTLKRSNLRKDQPKTIPKKTIRQAKKVEEQAPQKTAGLEVDLRGYRFEEVREALDQAIDRAMLTGLRSLRIIHGFGSGAVRKAVHDYIKGSPYITSHRYGGEGEGLNGVTIITLK